MNDMVLIVGGIVALIVIAGGGGWLYRFAFKRGNRKGDSPVVEQSNPTESVTPPYRG